MQTIISGTVYDPVKRTSYGARLVLAENGVIHSVTPVANPDPGFILPGFVDAHVHSESAMLTTP